MSPRNATTTSFNLGSALCRRLCFLSVCGIDPRGSPPLAVFPSSHFFLVRPPNYPFLPISLSRLTINGFVLSFFFYESLGFPFQHPPVLLVVKALFLGFSDFRPHLSRPRALFSCRISPRFFLFFYRTLRSFAPPRVCTFPPPHTGDYTTNRIPHILNLQPPGRR